MIKVTPDQNMHGHQRTIGKGGFPGSFLTHQMNHSRKGIRLVINFSKRKSSIIFPEFGYFLGKKTEKKNIAFKNVWFFFNFSGVHLLKTETEGTGNMFCIIVVSGCCFFLVAISKKPSQIKTVQLNISLTNNNKLFLWS